MTHYKVFQEVPQGSGETVVHIATVDAPSPEQAVNIAVLHIDAVQNDDGRQGYNEVKYMNPDAHLTPTRNLYAVPQQNFHTFDGDDILDMM